MNQVAAPAIEDVSASIAGLKPSERVYRGAAGYQVRVMTIRFHPGDLAALHFQITGALIGAAGAPDRLGAPHLLVVKPESAVDLAAVVEAERRKVVGWIEQAALHHAAASALTGVGAADV